MDVINLYEKSDKLFFVGGKVRDELLGIESDDVDLTYVGNAVEFVKSLGIKTVLQVNEEFGAVHLKLDDTIVDITSTRKEKYDKAGHLPVVTEIGCSLEEDVKRRDFTVNTLVKNCKTGEITDYTNGIEDLKNKTLRILHDKSFIDDCTRIIRGLKFAVRFGFKLDEHSKTLQNEYLNNVNYDMCFKRLKDELIDAFNMNKQEVLNQFIENKMYKLLSPDEYIPYKINVENIVNKYKQEIKNIWIIYLCGFNLSNISLTSIEQRILDDYKKISSISLNTDYEIYTTFKSVQNIESLIIYALLNDITPVEKYLDDLRYVKLNITGKDVTDLGYEPSKKLGQCLEYLTEQKLLNRNLTKEDELLLVKRFYEQNS